MHQLPKRRLSEGISVVVRMKADAGHLIFFAAAPEILLPVREAGIDGAERHENAATVAAAIVHKAGVGAPKILVKYSVEGACPCLGHIADAETGDETRWIISNQTGEWPPWKSCVCVGPG